MRAAHRKNTRDRFVETRPGPDGTTTWWAQLPAGASAAAWSAITTLGATYTQQDPCLTADQGRADAFMDLLLRNVQVSAKVTLGIPVITNPAATPDQAATGAAAATPDPGATPVPATTAPGSGTGTDPHVDADPAGATDPADATDPAGATDLVGPGAADREERAPAVGGQGLGAAFRISAAFSGCEVPGIGFIDADTIEALLATVPLEVARALLDATTGTLLETRSTAYRPPRAISDFVKTRDGACRMWGCDRPAIACDLDHVRPWPAGATSPVNLGDLCRRHHRLKQQGRWTYRLHPDGTITWTSPTGTKRTTLPDHATWPPPTPPPTPAATAPAPAPTDWGPPPF